MTVSTPVLTPAPTPAQRLAESARRGGLHHAVILYGPSAPLLRETAIQIAKTLNCLNRSLGDDCVSCAKIDRGVHPDLHIVEVAEDRKMIAVEQIRELVSGASLRPYEGRNKIFIIESAEAMSTSGANAMLKTLEEPTSDTIFMLLTRSADLLLPTIRSRSQAVHIRPVLLAPGASKKKSSPQTRALALMFPALEESEIRQVAADIIELLASFAEQKNGAALLALAARLEAFDEGVGLAIYASIMRDLVCRAASEMESPDQAAVVQKSISTDALLRSADVAMRASQRFVVNVDSRLQAEQAVAALVTTGP